MPWKAGEAPGGWLELPSGKFSRDPSSVDYSSNNFAWDQAVKHWVPVAPSNVSPDGTAYLTDDGSDLRIIDARTGAILHETQAQTHQTFPTGVVGYTPSAIYLQAGQMGEPGGLWKLDTASGALIQVSTAPARWDIDGNGNEAWGTDLGATLRILDLSTGMSRDIYKSSHRILLLVGLTSAGALVFEYDTGQLFAASVVTADGSVQPVNVPPALQGKDFNGFFQDGPTVLLSGHGFGIAAYDPEHGLQVLTTSPDNFKILGRCVAA